MMSASQSPGRAARPTRDAVVVPGKLEVLARAPHRRLNSVVLPVLGLPISATRATSPATGTAPLARVAANAISALVGGDDEDAVGDLAREPDAGRAHLHDTGFACLAQGQLALAGQAQRAQEVAGRGVE